jgi:hypothetical protein
VFKLEYAIEQFRAIIFDPQPISRAGSVMFAAMNLSKLGRQEIGINVFNPVGSG